MRTSSWLLCTVSLWLLGCQNLSRFEIKPGEAYCGSLISSPAFHEGLLPAGVPPVLPIRIELNLQALDTEPGSVTTGDSASGLCSGAGLPLFNHAPLRAIRPLQHDQLSQLQFGQGRDMNLMLWMDSTCQGSLLGVLSLMQDSSLEMRVFKPKPQTVETAPPSDQSGFGVFVLTQKPASNCAY